MYTSKELWIWLTVAFGPANPRKWNAVSHYNSVEEAYERIISGDMTYVMPQDLKSVKSASIVQAQKLIELCDKNGINIVTYEDDAFPQRLREIYNPPSVLFYIGDISDADGKPVITVVGTRKPSDYTVKVSGKICEDLARQGFIIASSFALGLDSVAHSAAIKAGGKTYAVLPCGILYAYPPENADKKQLIAKHGAVISEYFPNAKPTSLSFRARNRLLSGIGLGTLILQAGEKSGTLSTASFALSQGRDIFCIPPHDIFDDSYSGVVGLIRDGAIPVFDAFDVVNEYNGLYPHKLRTDNTVQTVSAPLFDESKKRPSQNKPSVKKKTAPSEKPQDNASDNPDEFKKDSREKHIPAYFKELTGVKKEIFEFIRDHGETHLDSLSVGIGDVYELEAFLTELELDGLIKALPGNRFTVC